LPYCQTPAENRRKTQPEQAGSVETYEATAQISKGSVAALMLEASDCLNNGMLAN